MLEQLKRPFKKVYGKVRSYVSRFVGPVKDSASKLFALIPGFKAFAGSEEKNKSKRKRDKRRKIKKREEKEEEN